MTNKNKPFGIAEIVSPNDEAEFNETRGVMIQSSGALAVRMANGNSIVLPAVQGGVVHALAVNQILATGTGAVGTVVVFR